MLNRNFLPPEKGYVYCLEVLRRMKPDYLLINQHIPPAFRFSAAQLDCMIENFRQRREFLADLFPWDDPNYGVDAQWARLYPYGSELAAGKSCELKAIILNHSPSLQEYRVTPHWPAGWQGRIEPLTLTLEPRREGSVAFTVTPPPGWAGTAVITADVAFGPWDLREWMEAMVTVKPAR